jgi:hypothetical protein
LPPSIQKVSATFAVAALVLLNAGHASAADADAGPRMQPRWYGWQTLVSDAASIATFAGGVALGGVPGNYLMGTAVAGYALGGPIVHFAHKNPGRGMASFGLRVPLPILLGAGTVALVCRGGGGDFCGVVAIPGGLLGIGLAIALDAAALARDSVPVEPGREASTLRLSPTISVSRREVNVGLALRM